MFLFLILVLRFTETAQKPHVFSATAGVDVTLPCDSPGKCDDITWTFSPSVNTITLVKQGKIFNEVKLKPDRLRVTEDCSLKISAVTDKDSGRYSCKLNHGEDSVFDLTVNNNVNTKGAKEGVKTTSTTTSKTAKLSMTKSPTTKAKRTAQSNSTASTVNDLSTELQVCWRLIIIAAGLAAFTVTVIAVIAVTIYVRVFSGSQTQTEDNHELISNSAGMQTGPQTSENTADPEDGVFYSSIKKTNNKPWLQDKVDTDVDDDEYSAVIYSTVKVSTAPSTDPSDLYATVNKRNK